MKRYLLIILVIVMAMFVIACGGAKNTDSKKGGTNWEDSSVANDLPHQETDKIEIIDETDNTEDTDAKTDDNADEEVKIDESNGSKNKKSKKDKNKKETSESLSPDFKKAMDSYEAFFDEYVKFMKKYMNADSDDILSMASDYADYMKKYTETMEAMNEINEDELSTAEALYYAEVNARISAKLLEVTE